MKSAPTTVVLLALVACSDRSSGPAEPRSEPAPAQLSADAGAPPTCEQVSFADGVDIAEASGAVWLGDPDRILVVGDSGTNGQYVELDPATGAVLAAGRLPLDRGASDDLEGLAAVDGQIYAITSSGAMRSWRRQDGGYVAVDAAYSVGELACDDLGATNCGRNFEGLCLRPRRDAAGFAGFAAAKADGKLYRLEWAGTRLRATGASIAVTDGSRLSGCAFDPAGQVVWTGSNFFERNAVRRVVAIDSPAGARIEEIGYLGPGFGEALALGPAGALYRFSDTAGAPSAVQKFVCK